LGVAHERTRGTRGDVVAWAVLAAGATCRQRRAQRDDNDTRIGSGGTVRCGRRLGMARRMGPGRHDTQIGCKRAQGSLVSVVVPQDGLQTGGAARELSGSGTDERQCSAQVRKAEPVCSAG
jgi:hypothetical protein